MKVIFLSVAVTIISTVSAHFTLDFPNSTGFSDSLENIPPCGGFVPNLSGSLVNFTVLGEWIQINNHHPESLLHYRISNEANLTWVDLNPIVHQVGIGTLCIKTGRALDRYIGTKGVIQVIGDGHGGALFQVPIQLRNPLTLVYSSEVYE